MVCGLCWACHGQKFKVCGFFWACYGQNVGTPVCQACGLCWATTDKIWELQNVRLVVLAGLATNTILEAQIVGFVVFAGPAPGEFWISTLLGLWFWLGLHGQDFGTPDCKVCGLCWACHG